MRTIYVDQMGSRTSPLSGPKPSGLYKRRATDYYMAFLITLFGESLSRIFNQKATKKTRPVFITKPEKSGTVAGDWRPISLTSIPKIMESILYRLIRARWF